MEKQDKSIGVIIFGTLMILGALIQLPSDFSTQKPLLQPLPEIVILAHYLIIKFLLILGIISGIGILCLKNIFRKIALITSLLVIIDYLIALPFFILKNVPDFIQHKILEIIAENPTMPQAPLSSIMWISIILVWIIDFGFAVCVIYFFTRPKVKEQFK